MPFLSFLPFISRLEILTPRLLGKITTSPTLTYSAFGPVRITLALRQAFVTALVGTKIPLR